MLKIEDVKIDERFERLTPVSKEEHKALENLIVADGEIHTPIIVWKDQKTLVDGHSRRDIQKKHPDLPYTIKEIEFQDWQEVIVWIVEHHIARKSFSLWQKLEMAMTCVDYWEAKAQAKRNKGARNDLKTPGVKKSKPIDTTAILAEKVGCGTTTVTQFLKVFRQRSEGLKQRCREGDMSIKSASKSLEPKNPPKKKPETTVENEKIDILAECEKNQTVSDKNNVTIPDPNPIAQQMTQPKIPDETMWFAINPVEQMMQIFMKKHDTDTGNNHIHVNSFIFKTVSTEDGRSILHVEHIGGSTEDITQKDDGDFDSEEKKAS